MSADVLALDGLVDLVGDRVADEIKRREEAGLAAMDRADERRFARSVLKRELRSRNETALAAGRDPLSPDAEVALIGEALNAVFGFGELERWLQDPNVQDIHILSLIHI